MVSDVTAAIAQSLRTSIRNEALASWALTSLPAVYTDTHTAAKDVLAVLSSMQDFTLADVLHHMHLSELLHCPESLQQIALAGKVQQSCCMLRQQLAWHPRCKQGCPAPASSFFSSYARYIQKLKVCAGASHAVACSHMSLQFNTRISTSLCWKLHSIIAGVVAGGIVSLVPGSNRSPIASSLPGSMCQHCYACLLQHDK